MELKIQADKSYNLRDGSVVHVTEVDDTGTIQAKYGDNGYNYGWCAGGKWLVNRESGWDFVSEVGETNLPEITENDVSEITDFDTVESEMEERLEPWPEETIAELTFGQALIILKSGGRVTRRGWNGKGQFIELQIPDEHSKMQHPYIYISPVDGKLVPWLASQTDMLAEDWMVRND